MNKREFIIGLGLGLVIATTFSLAGYLFVLSDLRAVPQTIDDEALSLPEWYKDPSESNIFEPDDNTNDSDNELDENTAEEATPPEEQSDPISVIEPEDDSSIEDNQLETFESPPVQALQASPPPQSVAPQQSPRQAAQSPVSRPSSTQQTVKPPVPSVASQAQPRQTPQAPQKDVAQTASVQAVTETDVTETDVNETVQITIDHGESSTELAAKLSNAGVIKEASDFEDYLGDIAMYVTYTPGTYEIKSDDTYEEILDKLTKE